MATIYPRHEEGGLFAGGLLLLFMNADWYHAWPSSVVNLVWIGIALVALIRAKRGACLQRCLNSLKARGGPHFGKGIDWLPFSVRPDQFFSQDQLKR
jgi:hypothetical protein